MPQSANPEFMLEAIRLATENVGKGEGGPFGAVIVRAGKIVATGVNRVTANSDPTAHAEINAIRAACKSLNDFQLEGCEIYTSCEPCPMCLGAIYWARPDAIYYGNTCVDAAEAGFDDSLIYREMKLARQDRQIPMIRLLPERAIESFLAWKQQANKVGY